MYMYQISINIISFHKNYHMFAISTKIVIHFFLQIIEHLLAMSDLLDLGFHEKDVSVALLECDNDRDKALDKLIT